MITDGRGKRGLVHALAAAGPALACLFCAVCLPAGIGVLAALFNIQPRRITRAS